MTTLTRFLVFSFILGAFSLGRAASTDGLAETLEQLQAQANAAPAREVLFSERRFFPFRKEPVELEGVLRMWEGRGLSISYPEKRIGIVADDEGVLMRKYAKDGAFRQKDAGASQAETVELMKAAFAFDVVALQESFDMEWRGESEGWTIAMTPKEGDRAKIERLTVSGKDATVERIEMSFAGDRRVEIHPKEETVLSGFSDEDEQMYFRHRSGE